MQAGLRSQSTETSPVFSDIPSCSAQLAASSPPLQALFCQKTGRSCKRLISGSFPFASVERFGSDHLFSTPIQ